MASKSEPNVVRIKPLAYIHILDNNTNVTRLEVGPQTYTRKEHEQIVVAPTDMVMIPPRHYCIISNPVLRDAADGHVLFDVFGNPRLRHGDQEVRFEQKPFALYPGEVLFGKVTALQVVAANAALRLRAIRSFTDENGVKREAGEEWLFKGSGTYHPKVEVQVVEIIRAQILKENEALRLRARRELVDASGCKRQAGEEWLYRQAGAYLPNVDEEIVGHVEARLITDKKALHLRAVQTFTDVFGKKRQAGSEWLVTLADAEVHIPHVYEEVVKEVGITTLSNRQFCVVLDPVHGTTGKNQFGKRDLRVGECSFFLLPGESLENGIQNVFVLRQDEALLLRAIEAHRDKRFNVDRRPGELWMVVGACEFVPEVSIEIVEKRRQIPLDKNEGIYVRNICNGNIRSVIGESYMLQPDEELWKKPLSAEIESLLSLGPREYQGKPVPRDASRVVSYRAPHNSAVQVYDYKSNRSRVIFGPDLVMLQPDEQFTVLSLSGGKPKVADQIKSLGLLLGPDFMTDIVTVETSDHARLSLQLAYNWHFEVDRTNPAEVAGLFSVPDFVGDVTKAVASRVRGAVAASTFDNFHKDSALIIREAVFGKGKDLLKFPANGLVITNIDIQSVEPIDQRTRDSLQKSVQLAIEITTKSQEASARHEAERKAQEATGALERQKIVDEARAEEERVELLKLQAMTMSVESTGQATADACAKKDAALIVGKSEVDQARLRSSAVEIKQRQELEQLTAKQQAELAHRKQVIELELTKAEELARIESEKFKQIVDSIGAQTIRDIAQAGPEMQAKLLSGLGLQGFLLTDGNSPINLFNAANSMVGGSAAAAPSFA